MDKRAATSIQWNVIESSKGRKSRHATAWVKINDVMLSVISLLQKGKYCLIPIVDEIPRGIKSIGLKKGLEGGEMNGELVFMGQSFHLEC